MANQAFEVIVRRLSTGCDFRIRLFAKDWETAAERATDRARRASGIALTRYSELHKQGGAVFRVVSCEISDDQSRPLDFA